MDDLRDRIESALVAYIKSRKCKELKQYDITPGISATEMMFPLVVVAMTDSVEAFPNSPPKDCQVSIVVMTKADDETLEGDARSQHLKACGAIEGLFSCPETVMSYTNGKKRKKVKGLHIYNIMASNAPTSEEDRGWTSVFEYNVMAQKADLSV